MPTADLNGTTIWYDVVGAGPPCLVLHGGLGVDHILYQGTLTPLEQRLRLVYLDHRGNGRSGRPPLDTITIEQLADDAAALARHLGEEWVAVIGHSYGGFVAQELVLRHPDLVAALVLIDTTPGQLGATEDRDDEQGPPPPPEVVAVLATLPSTNETMANRVRQLMPHYLHRRDPSEFDAVLDATIFEDSGHMPWLDEPDYFFEVVNGWLDDKALAPPTA